MENEETFNLRISKELREKLDTLAQKHRRSRADVIRLMIETGRITNETE